MHCTCPLIETRLPFACSAKSGSDWTANELVAYNITVVHQDAATFFEISNLPQLAINPTLDYHNAPDDDTYSLIRNSDLAMVPVISESPLLSILPWSCCVHLVTNREDGL